MFLIVISVIVIIIIIIIIITLLKSQCYLADHKSSTNRQNSNDTFLVGLVGKLEYPLKNKGKESGIKPGHFRVPLFEGKQCRKTDLFGLITIHDLLCCYLKGGYDDRVVENKEHYLELRKLADQYNLISKVTFLRSFSDSQKLNLLNCCTSLLYTPSHEHFGIVPIEAMYMKRPVIAVNSGGPLETVQDEVTGFLCDPDAESFAVAMQKFMKDPSLSSTMGEAGKENVIKQFSFEVFSQHLNSIVCCLYLLEFDAYPLD